MVQAGSRRSCTTFLTFASRQTGADSVVHSDAVDRALLRARGLVGDGAVVARDIERAVERGKRRCRRGERDLRPNRLTTSPTCRRSSSYRSPADRRPPEGPRAFELRAPVRPRSAARTRFRFSSPQHHPLLAVAGSTLVRLPSHGSSTRSFRTIDVFSHFILPWRRPRRHVMTRLAHLARVLAILRRVPDDPIPITSGAVR